MKELKSGWIKWYNTQRGFGVIIGDDNKEYFLHHSNIASGVSRISEGMRVNFEARSRPKNKGGYEAFNVKFIREYSPVKESTEINPPIILPTSVPSESSTFSKKNLLTDYWYDVYTKWDADNFHENKEQILDIRVVGVTYEGRQAIVSKLTLNEEVLLIRDPHNPFDKNAIKVTRRDGEHFGFIGRDLAARLANKLDAYGKPATAIVTSIQGGYYIGSNLGVMIRFRIPNVGEESMIDDDISEG